MDIGNKVTNVMRSCIYSPYKVLWLNNKLTMIKKKKDTDCSLLFLLFSSNIYQFTKQPAITGPLVAGGGCIVYRILQRKGKSIKFIQIYINIYIYIDALLFSFSLFAFFFMYDMKKSGSRDRLSVVFIIDYNFIVKMCDIFDAMIKKRIIEKMSGSKRKCK